MPADMDFLGTLPEMAPKNVITITLRCAGITLIMELVRVDVLKETNVRESTQKYVAIQ